MPRTGRGVGDDVAGIAGLHRADGDDAELCGILLAADHALHVDDEVAGHHHRIDGHVRPRAVAALADEDDRRLSEVELMTPGL